VDRIWQLSSGSIRTDKRVKTMLFERVYIPASCCPSVSISVVSVINLDPSRAN